MHQIKLADNIFYLGFNDRRTALFENIWPIPDGICYNSYLIVDEKVALVDTMERQYIEDYLERITDIIGDRAIDYLIINHMEPDHSGSLKAIVNRYPGITLVGNRKTFGIADSRIPAFRIGPGYRTPQIRNGHLLDFKRHKSAYCFSIFALTFIDMLQSVCDPA